MNENEANAKMWKIRETICPRLAARYAGGFNAAHAVVDDAVSAAFEYAAAWLMAQGGDFTASGVERLMCSKLANLLKDADAAKKLKRGRKSVRALPVLDAHEEDDGSFRNRMVDAASLSRHQEREVDAAVSRRNLALYRCSFGCRNRAELADRFGVTVNNANVIVCKVQRRALELKSEIQERYLEFAMAG